MTMRSMGGKKESKSSKRKLEKKQKFYAKVEENVSSLGAKKAITKKKKQRSRQKKLKAYDLSALSECLPDSDASRQTSTTVTNLKLNCKNRQKLVEREGAQLRLVLNDPRFKIDPLSAIHQHLQRTQPPTTNKETTNKEKEPGKARKNKKERSKRLSLESQMMDI